MTNHSHEEMEEIEKKCLDLTTAILALIFKDGGTRAGVALDSIGSAYMGIALQANLSPDALLAGLNSMASRYRTIYDKLHFKKCGIDVG
jgi:hypothetical protein